MYIKTPEAAGEPFVHLYSWHSIRPYQSCPCLMQLSTWQWVLMLRSKLCQLVLGARSLFQLHMVSLPWPLSLK